MNLDRLKLLSVDLVQQLIPNPSQLQSDELQQQQHQQQQREQRQFLRHRQQCDNKGSNRRRASSVFSR